MYAQSLPSQSISTLARAGLIAKGIVYCLLGLLAFLAAFELGGGSQTADKQGVFRFVEEQTGGKLLLGLISFGLLCYSAWRLLQGVHPRFGGMQKEGWKERIRYTLSGLAYLSLSLYAGKMVLDKPQGGGNNQQQFLSSTLQESWGQWLVGLVALLIAAIGVYQIIYGYTEKYMKHISAGGMQGNASRTLLRSGKIGYIARGVVWIIIGWLLGQAALHANSSEAGNTAKAFQFLEESYMGSYLLGAVGLGLICYGIFSFMRARYESFR